MRRESQVGFSAKRMLQPQKREYLQEVVDLLLLLGSVHKNQENQRMQTTDALLVKNNATNFAKMNQKERLELHSHFHHGILEEIACTVQARVSTNWFVLNIVKLFQLPNLA